MQSDHEETALYNGVWLAFNSKVPAILPPTPPTPDKVNAEPEKEGVYSFHRPVC